MSKMNPGVLFDASRSWNGYNHQGKLALVFAVQEITGLVCAGSSREEDIGILRSHFLEIEYMEDFSIGCTDSDGKAEYISVHQVKDRKDTAPSKYKSAIQGLAKHLIDDPSIEKAYLHVTSELNLQKDFGEYVSDMVLDVQWITEHEKNAQKENDMELLRELGEMKKQFLNFSQAQMKKISLQPYRIRGTDQTFCPEDQASVLLKESLRDFYQKKYPGTDKPERTYVEKSYLYMMGRLDQHIVDRSLNYDAYEANEKDRRILFSQVYEWLVSEEIGANGDAFYLYHIKEEYFRLAAEHCRKCQRRNGTCRPDCQIPIFKDRLGELSFPELEAFVYRTTPDIDRELSMGTFSRFLQTGKVKDPLLKGVHEILAKIPTDRTFDAVSYRDRQNQQYALTTLARDDSEDEYEDCLICTSIAQNELAFPLLMDYDCLISRDVCADSVFASNLSVAPGDFDREAENIIRPKNVGIITLEQFIKQFGKDGESA